MQHAVSEVTTRQLEELEALVKLLSSHSDKQLSKINGLDKILERASDLLGEDAVIIDLSRREYDASVYRAIKKLLGATNKEYQRLFKHTWRSVSDRAGSEKVHWASSERVLLLLKILVQGVLIFGDVRSARTWLHKYNPNLDQAPGELLDTITGCRKVSDELGRIEHGLLA